MEELKRKFERDKNLLQEENKKLQSEIDKVSMRKSFLLVRFLP